MSFEFVLRLIGMVVLAVLGWQLGISLAGDVMDLGMKYDLIKKTGTTFSYNEIKLGVGRENAKKFLRGDKKLMGEIKKKIWQAVDQAE